MQLQIIVHAASPKRGEMGWGFLLVLEID